MGHSTPLPMLRSMSITEAVWVFFLYVESLRESQAPLFPTTVREVHLIGPDSEVEQGSLLPSLRAVSARFPAIDKLWVTGYLFSDSAFEHITLTMKALDTLLIKTQKCLMQKVRPCYRIRVYYFDKRVTWTCNSISSACRSRYVYSSTP